MRIAVVGPGALGCLFATKLYSAAEHDSILLIDHRPDRAKLLNQQGIIFESESGRETFAVPVFHDPTTIPAVDILISCVKSYDLQTSFQFLKPLLYPGTLFVFLQNGIGHLQYNAGEKPGAIPVFGSSSEGATRLGIGHIRHAGSGHTTFGFLNEQNTQTKARLQQLLSLLQKSGFASSISDDIRARLWAKLFVNVGINGLTVLENCSNGQLLESDKTREKLILLVREAEAVAKAQGIAIVKDPVDATLAICKNTAQNISSMLQDVRNRRPTEIESINGAVCTIGRKYNIPTPENDRLAEKIREISLYTENE